MPRRKLAAGNWKMNGTSADLAQISALMKAHPDPGCDILICPPATLLARMAWHVGSAPIAIGGQDCHAEPMGAHTGDIAASMLADAGATYVILGHSERRHDHGEPDALICAKARTVLAAGLNVVICVGETLAEREAATTLDIIGRQLAGSIPDDVTGQSLVVAYEPVWAIGTGQVPTIQQIGEVHDFIRAQLEQRLGSNVALSVRVLYGGSVKATNATEIFAVSNVDGALVGGASLKAADFSPIIAALEAAGA